MTLLHLLRYAWVVAGGLDHLSLNDSFAGAASAFVFLTLSLGG